MRGRTWYTALLALLTGALALGLTACGSSNKSSSSGAPSGQPGKGKPAVTLGTKNFTEEYVLGQLYLQALEAKGFKVNLKNNIGSSEIIDKGLTSGNIDFYPEYIGVGLTAVAHDNKAYGSAQEAYDALKQFNE